MFKGRLMNHDPRQVGAQCLRQTLRNLRRRDEIVSKIDHGQWQLQLVDVTCCKSDNNRRFCKLHIEPPESNRLRVNLFPTRIWFQAVQGEPVQAKLHLSFLVWTLE